MLKSLLKNLADNSQASSLANRLRQARMDVLREFIQPLAKPVRVLDVGGTQRFWTQSGLSDAELLDVVLLNVVLEPVDLPNFSSVVGDARDLSQFASGEFDLVFSNSVIEHVGDFPSQKKMAEEIRRVGKRFFVQTPAKYFPIEPHFLCPFFSYLPEAGKVFLLTHFRLGWYPKQNSAEDAREFLRWFRLLTRTEMRELFPESNLKYERFLGLTKSYLAMGQGVV